MRLRLLPGLGRIRPPASTTNASATSWVSALSGSTRQVELPGGAETVRHDHRDDGAEDAYAILRGEGVVVVDDQEVVVASGDFIAVTPDATRYVRAGEDGLVFIAVCASTAF